jgi:hypothetical protein
MQSYFSVAIAKGNLLTQFAVSKITRPSKKSPVVIFFPPICTTPIFIGRTYRRG